MATLYLKAAGGNWTAAGTWSNVNAAGGDSSGPPTASDDCIAELASGNCTISAASVGKTFSTTAGTGSWGGTLTHNAFNWTVSGSITFNSGITYTPLATSTVTLNATNTLTSAGKLFPLMALSTGTTTLADNLSFMASKVITLTLSGNVLDLNGKTISGNSAINRVLVASNTLGTPRTITISSGSADAADFRDITASAAWDLSAAAAFSGDCGGNTSITFTTAATQTYDGTTANWSTAARWTSRVPLPQDDVTIGAFGGASRTLTCDMPRVGRSIDCSGVTNSPTVTFNLVTGHTNYGSITFISAMTKTNAVMFTMEGRGVFTLTCAGWAPNTPFEIAMVGGTLTLQDSLIGGSNMTFSVSAGTLNVGANNLSMRRHSAGTFNLTRTINMGSGTWTLTTDNETAWTPNTSGLTLNAQTSTIALTSTNAGNTTFAGGGLTYNNLSITGGAGVVIIITGANTFGNLPQFTNATTIKFTAATTTTFTGGTNFGNGSNAITIASVTAAQHTLSKTSGIISGSSLNITNSAATGGATWYAGATPPSVDGGGNSGWIFTAAPGGSSGGSSLASRNIGSLTTLATALY